jgi:hypothetical protein
MNYLKKISKIPELSMKIIKKRSSHAKTEELNYKTNLKNRLGIIKNNLIKSLKRDKG